MKPSQILLSVGLVSTATAASLKHYQPASNIETAFGDWLLALYTTAEDAQATTAFTNYFTSDGRLTVGTTTEDNPTDIIALKQKLLPTDGHKKWNHNPYTVIIAPESSAPPGHKVYHVSGWIESTFTPGNCSQAQYETLFYIAYNADGTPNLKAHGGGLWWYDDYSVTPSTSPTNIACDQ